MTYIPKSLGEILDQIGFMVLGGPDFQQSQFPDQNLETVFHQLCEGLNNLRKTFGEVAYRRLFEAASEAKKLYESGHDEKGNEILQHMGEYIRLHKYRTDEDVVDVSRFE